jgi:hypothetical protein
MNKSNRQFKTMIKTPVRQQGMVTTFTGVLILVLMTLMMFFAIRVGVFEQRVSANDLRQKLAFHTAESGIQHAKEFLRANSALLMSEQEDVLGNGFDGWFSATDSRWVLCPGDLSDYEKLGVPNQGWHPCHGEPDRDMRPNMYYYTVEADDSPSALPIQIDDIIPGTTETVTVQALMCVLDLDKDEAVPVQGCAELNSTSAVGTADGTYFMVTILARGGADCTMVGGEPVCNANALVSEQVSNFGAASGGRSPEVPLTTKSSFPPSGTAEVVPNPNAGGIGVPVSVWMNNNTSCSNGSVFDPSSGSWSTCEMHEWYGVDKKPDDMACSGTCSCTEAESLSYTDATTNILGIDLVSDEEFPCDLFQFYFGIPRTSYELVRGFSKIISNCDALDSNSSGIYWVSGPECRVNSNTVIGSKDNPVLLISAATLTKFNGGASLYGVLFITDVEDLSAEFQSVGTNTVYGSVINDAILGSYQGTFQVVWAEDVSEKAGNGGGLGSVLGGWSDFHNDWKLEDSL